MNAAWLRQPITIYLLLSAVLHALILFLVGPVLPDLRKQADFLQSLEVVLVNAKSKSEPARPDVLAQHNLDGGGNTAEQSRASSPLPTLQEGRQYTAEQASRRVQQLEQEAQRLMTQANSSSVVTAEKAPSQPVEKRINSDALIQRSMEIARLEAQIDKEMNLYQKMPRKKFIGARAQEYRFAQYVEDWRIKIERIGNLNYPEAARQKRIYGSLQLTVSIRADGTIESMEVSRPSGQPILDAAAQRIVQMAAPFMPFPPDISRDTDIISITRTWTFTQSDRLESK